MDVCIPGEECSSRSNSDVGVGISEAISSSTDSPIVGVVASSAERQDGAPGDGSVRGGDIGTRDESDMSEDRKGKNGGSSSQGGFWYGEGGGASALEAALGQWGGDLDGDAFDLYGHVGGHGEINHIAVSGDDDNDDKLNDGLVEDEGDGQGGEEIARVGVELGSFPDSCPSTPRPSNCGDGGGRVENVGDPWRRIRCQMDVASTVPGTGAAHGGAVDGEDDSWEFVDAPKHCGDGSEVNFFNFDP